MSNNVITLSHFSGPKIPNHGALLYSFAKMRRDGDEVFWLKENAELLNIFESSALKITSHDLAPYTKFYHSLPDRMAFFPQYYRFFLSIALDLEALGMPGEQAQSICASVHQQGLVRAELSDLQRAETSRLLARRGFECEEGAALRARLHRFINHSATFALPNRKAAYELTHIVFYLSQYGRCDPMISEDATQSLMFCGILAHLDQNTDLLAEICIALRYAGKTPPPAWEAAIASTLRSFEITSQDAGAGDQYHTYLVGHWALAQMGHAAFADPYTTTSHGFYAPEQSFNALGAVSEALLMWDAPRHSQWDRMKDPLLSRLSQPVAQHLSQTVEATPDFEAFFSHFVRAACENAAPNPQRSGRLHQLNR